MHLKQKINENGFTLIEIAIVIIIMGILISVAASVLPSLLRTGKIRHARSILEKYDYTVEGYFIANGRCPCPDTDSDGVENRVAGTPSPTNDTCTSYTGDLPYATLGLQTGNDNWVNPVRYSVNPSLVTTQITTYCSALAVLAGTSAVFDSSAPYTKSGSVTTNMAWILVSGGAKDLDGSGGYFDGLNGNTNNLEFEIPDKIVDDENYDDVMRAVSFSYLSGRECSGGGSGSGGGTGDCTDVESVYCGTCDDGIDNDSKNGSDCSDPACATYPGCVNPTCSIATDSDLGNGTINYNLSSTISASQGCVGSLTWSLTSNGGFSGLNIHPYTGLLSGTLNQCPGTYNGISVKVEDANSNFVTKNFSVVVTSDLSVTRTGSDSSVNITWSDADFEADFQTNGGHLQDISWSLDAGGAIGFSVEKTGEDTCRIVTDGSTLAGNYTFILSAKDSGCPSKNYKDLQLFINVPADLAPSWTTFDLEAVWHFDECTSWDGTPGEVIDSGGGTTPFNGVSKGASNTGSGKICRAAVFDASNQEYIDMGDILDGLKAGSKAFTIAAWVYPYDLDSSIQPVNTITNHKTQNCFISNASDAHNDNFEIGINENGSVHVYIDTVSKDTYADFGSAGAVPKGRWSFISIVYNYDTTAPNDTTVTVQINDKVITNTSSWKGSGGLDQANGSPFTIGATQHYNNYFTGKIDEVMAFTRALTTDEIDVLYQRGFSGISCSGDCYTQPVASNRMENFPWTGNLDEVIDEGYGGNNGVASSWGTGVIPSQTSTSGGKSDQCRAAVLTKIDGSNGGYLDFGDPSDGDFDPGTDLWTISTWFNWGGSSGENIIYNKENLFEARVYNGYLNYAWQPHWVWDGGTSYKIDKDTWSYLTIVYDGKQQILYKDGIPVYYRTQTGSIGSNSSKLFIGARGSSNPHNFFGGMVDNFKIYNRALSESEINSDYNEKMSDCPADMVTITTTSPLTPEAVVNSDYTTTLNAKGGDGSYVWEITGTNPVSGLSIDGITGVLSGTVNVCSGTYTITIKVSDTGGTSEERNFTLTVNNPSFIVSPSSPKTLICNTSGFYEDFTILGAVSGKLTNWQIVWNGAAINGFEVISTGTKTARFRKTGAVLEGSGMFKLTAVDSGCPDNTLDTGYYSLVVQSTGTGAPYYSGLAGDYWLDELSGTSVSDHSGNDNNGSVVSDVILGVQGKVWTAFEFDNNGEYIDVPDSSTLDLTSQISLAAWIKPQLQADGSYRRIIIKPYGSTWTAPYYSYSLFIHDASSGAKLCFGIGDGTTRQSAEAGVIEDNKWQHVVGTYDGSEMKWYIDKKLVHSVSSSLSIAVSDQDLKIGYAAESSHQFIGAIDEVKIFGRAISSDDITDLYNESSLVAYYHLDDTSGSIYDSSGQANHGTNYGADYGVDGKINYALEFDGSDYVDLGNNSVLTPDDISISVWANASTLSTWNGIVTNKPNALSGINLQMGTSQNIAALVSDGSSYLYIKSATVPVVNTWYHIVITHNSSDDNNILYVNGVSEASAVKKLQYSLPVNTIIGRFYTNSLPFIGKIDELRIYNRVLSSDEVLSLYNQGN